MSSPIKITECPRDAMQGLAHFIPTHLKIEYHNLLLKVGFDTLDFGSFVSAKAIPQMQDTAEVIKGLDIGDSATKLLAIIANTRGAQEACEFPEIHYLGFPLSVSETFQQRNTHASIGEALQKIEEIQSLCVQKNKELTVYLSMGFGNPYGDAWSPELVENYAEKLIQLGINRILLADTVGSSQPEGIQTLVQSFHQKYPQIALGVHLHSLPEQRIEKIESAYLSGCLNFDVAIRGFGGCPMAKEELLGNVATESLISYFESINIDLQLDTDALRKAMDFSSKIFA